MHKQTFIIFIACACLVRCSSNHSLKEDNDCANCFGVFSTCGKNSSANTRRSNIGCCPSPKSNSKKPEREWKRNLENVATRVPNIKDLWDVYPLTVLENSKNISLPCEISYNRFLRKLYTNDLRAAKMFDANAKLSSGILRGNVNQYGDFDECMELEEAQYCLAEVNIEPLWTNAYDKYKDLVHSHFAIQETFDDPKHRVPGFTMIRWGFCIPRECTNEDLEKAIHQKLGIQSRINSNMCQLANKKISVTYGDIIARSFFLSVMMAVIFSTYLYNRTPPKANNKYMQLLSCFSLQRNYFQLLDTQEKNEEIQALHGVRALSALALIISHKVMALYYNPYMNRTTMMESFNMKWSVIGRTAILYTECFMVLSGLLNANLLFADLEKTSSMKLKDKIVNRLSRILPSLIAVILFCTYILPNLGSGPLWPLVVNHHAELCKKYMWRNIFLIHNYFGFENMCLTHTHQVGIDMQLFLITPAIVYLIWYHRNIGYWTLGILTLSSTMLRFWVTWENNLSHVVHFGIPISRMFKTASLSYILPTHRATVYLIGVFLAYLLRYSSKMPNFSKVKLCMIWVVMYIAAFSTWLGPVHMSVKEYKYNRLGASFYGALSPILWGGSVAWVIYAVNRGFGSWFTPLLSWSYFVPFTKIAYAVYLVQFPVFFYNVGKTKHVDEYKPYMMMQVTETGLILLVSVILTLTIELPFQNIRRVLFDKEKKNSPTEETECPNSRHSKLG